MDQSIKNLSDSIVQGVKTQLGDAWDATLSSDDRLLITAVADDAATLAIAVAASSASPSSPSESLAAEQAQITAQLANIGAAEEVNLVNTFWGVTQSLMQKAADLAAGAIVAATL